MRARGKGSACEAKIQQNNILTSHFSRSYSSSTSSKSNFSSYRPPSFHFTINYLFSNSTKKKEIKNSVLLSYATKSYFHTVEKTEKMINNKETAAILIIAEEILNGSISDKNIPYLSKYLFARGIRVRKIEVVTDNVNEIVEAVQRLKDQVKYIFTTGGIGPTHDDLTYEALAEAYECPVMLHENTKEKLSEVLKAKNSPLTPGRLRMCTLPSPPPPFNTTIETNNSICTTTLSSPDRENAKGKVVKYHQHESLWVPLVEIENQTFIFPGVPSIFQNMLNLFEPNIPKNTTTTYKVNVYTKHLEGDIAATLYEAESLFSDISIGSYPHYRPVQLSDEAANGSKNILSGKLNANEKMECVQIRICIQSSNLENVGEVVSFLKSRLDDCQDDPFVPYDPNH